MEPPAIAARGITGRAEVFRVHESRDSSGFALICERQQVEHQFDVLFERLRRPHRRLRHILFRSGLGLTIKYCLDAALDLANIVEISIDPDFIRSGKSFLETDCLLDDRIENTEILALARETLFGRAAVAKEFLEDDLRTVFHR